LFALFPDLPWPRLRSREDQASRMRRLVIDARQRADANVERHRVNSAEMRERLAARQLEMLTRPRRPSLPARRHP
jgi:hypothetical protein